MRILVVEDDQLLNKTLSYNLSAVGYSVDGAMSKAVAIRFLEKQDYDLIVLDVNLPDGNGFDICREVKERRPDTAVIFLTANDMESDMLKGFELGADDYVTKPFPISVFQKKVSALLNRISAQSGGDFYDDGNLYINFSELSACLAGQPITLTSLEYRLLKVLTRNSQTVLTRQVLLEKLWDTLHFNHVQMDGLSSSIDNSFDCKVMAKVLINENTDTIRSTGFAKFYMPTEVFLPLCDQPHLVSFPFNAVDGMEADMEEFLSSYVEDIEPSMNYDSKQTYINSFNDLTSLIITIGGALSIIIGLIGVTNFVNSVLTSIITRRKELAMLQSIGMTGKQLKKMLSFEGLYYAAGTVVASIVFGSLVSVIIVRAISNSIWFFTYKFVIFPMFVIYPFLIALTVIIPAIIYRKIAKTSIIERLHQN